MCILKSHVNKDILKRADGQGQTWKVESEARAC